MSTKILCVDDEPNVLEGYQRSLWKRFVIDIASGGEAALKRMAQDGPYAVVVADMRMPVMNGIEFLVHAQQVAPDTVRLMLTGNADQKTAVEAMNRGHVYQFLNKPCAPEVFALALENGLKQHRLITAERELLEKTLNGSIKMLTEILASVEPQSFGHGEKLRDYMRTFAASLEVAQSWELELAAMLARIGSVTVPPGLWEKVRLGQGLSGPEKDMLARLPETGATLLAHVPRLEPVAESIRYQKKNFDGSGFPHDSVAGHAIPIGARVLRVLSDLVDLEAEGLSKTQALERMQACAGRYDPQVLDTTFACFDLYLSVPTAAKAVSKALSLGELNVGQVLGSDVETASGVRLVCAGTRVSPMLLEKLRNFHELEGIKEPLYVES